MIFGLFHKSEGDTTMAEGQSLTTRHAFREVLVSEHADVLRESVALMVSEMMELEVDRLVEQMGLRGLSNEQVSRMCRRLDEQVQAFRERPPEGSYPYLWLDAKIERVREPGGVRQKALIIAY